MRLSALILAGLVLVGAPAGAVPVLARHATGDAWDIGEPEARAPCQRIRAELAFPVAAAQRAAAMALLRGASVRRLEASVAADLLQQPSARTLFTDLLVQRFDTLQARRDAVFERHMGSWSDLDTITQSDLVEMMQPHYPPYRPYLVRALVGERAAPDEGFNIHLCGDLLTIDSLTSGDGAVRTPIILFLQSPPRLAYPSWY